MIKKVLVVDDEEKLRENVKVFLELNDYEVCTAPNGEEGLQSARENRPDLIIADIMMPKMDGYTMLRELKFSNDLKNIPVIMLTAKDGLSDLCEIEGSAEFIVKPFELEQLLGTIKKFDS